MDDQPTDYIQQVSSTSPDFKTELAKKLQEVVPEAITDGKVDTKKLKELLDDDAADDSERFGLFWPGKKRATRAAQEPTTATLKPSKSESKDWDTTQNLFIEGDNLEVLKVMQKHYHNKIKMIYIDPPYNTGKDFVYPDNFKEGLQNYLEFTNQVDNEGRKISTNSDTDGRYHSNWLSMMYPRLKLARNLLRDDGVIFISIDDHEAQNLLKICNEVFGEGNFVAQIPWRKRTAKSDVPFGVSQDFEWIISFARTTDFKARVEGKGRKYYTTKDLPDRAWRVHDLTKQTTASERPNSYFTIVNPKNGKEYPANPNRTWAITQETFDKYYNLNRIVFPGDYDFLNISKPALRYFEEDDIRSAGEDHGFIAVSTLLPQTVGMTKEGTSDIDTLFSEKVFTFPKPTSLISYLAGVSSKNTDIILDLFSGSGTTAHAIMQLNSEDGGNRKHIQIQLPEPTDEKSEAHKAGYKTIADIAKERIRRAGEKVKKDYADKLAERDTALDTGLRVYRLADSNFSKWRTSSDVDVDDLQQRLLDMRESSDDNASQDDLLTEILLKLGISLTSQTTQKDISGLQVWDIGNGAIAAYLDEHTKPTLDQLRTIADTEPAKFVILEDAFQGDDELKTNLSQICKTNKIELWTV